MPDIDVDFCYERRDEVLAYVRDKYGQDNVAHIITFGTLKGKAVLRDVGRTLGFTFGETDRICKLYPAPQQGRDYSLTQALEMEPRMREIRDSGEREQKLFDYALKLEGLARHVSKHAAGIVISDRPLVEDVPLFVDKDGNVMTQYAGAEIEAIGLVKFDFLGLKTLTLVADVVRRVEAGHGTKIDVNALPLDDPMTYRLLARANTVGVFQMEGGGMRKLLTQSKPSTFEDIIAVLALFRPGPLESGMHEDYVARKHGRARVTYMDNVLEPILRDTYGVIIYQEQVMQIAQVYSGFSLGQADNLRRAMGKKKLAAMESEKAAFIEGAEKLGRRPDDALRLYELIKQFAAYGFNKSHSAAYALITYQTAYLKAHYPREFLAALLSLEMGSTDKTYKNLADCREHGVAVLAPDANFSQADFTVVDEGLRFGLGAIKGVGEKAIEAITEARKEEPFVSLADLCLRTVGSQVTRRVLECLIRAGALTSISESRASLMAALDGSMTRAARIREDRAAGQMGLFGAAPDTSEPEVALPEVAEWDSLEQLHAEHESIGFYVSGHPLDRYMADLDLLNSDTSVQVHARPGSGPVRMAGVIHTVQRKNSRKGDRYATFHLQDREGVVEVITWPEAYRTQEGAILGREPVLITGNVEVGERAAGRADESPDEGGADFARKVQIIAETVVPLSVARRAAVRALELRLVSGVVEAPSIESLMSTLEKFPGTCPAFIRVVQPGQTETEIELPERYAIDPCDALMQAAGSLLGQDNVVLR